MAPSGRAQIKPFKWRLGAEVTMVGCVGNDPFGETLIRSLSDAGVIQGILLKRQYFNRLCSNYLDVSSSKAANRMCAARSKLCVYKRRYFF